MKEGYFIALIFEEMKLCAKDFFEGHKIQFPSEETTNKSTY